MLPGVGVHYLDTSVSMQCLSAQPDRQYVPWGMRKTLKITGVAHNR
jgi:hypothetical protein